MVHTYILARESMIDCHRLQFFAFLHLYLDVVARILWVAFLVSVVLWLADLQAAEYLQYFEMVNCSVVILIQEKINFITFEMK